MNKNLKKVISAVGALSIMASSVAAFAVEFPDVASDASYAQAVSELSALGVINGYEDGTFKPDNLVTRAEISTMIVAALDETSSAQASSGATKFADAQGHWAAGYINQGVNDGWISGHSDTEFAPDDNVTFVQAQKMLVAAIGYDTYAQAQGGWPGGYKLYAGNLDITKGVSGVSDDTQLTRAQVAQMIDNAMNAPLCLIVDWEVQWNGTKVPVLEVKDGEGKDYQTLFTNKHDAYKVFGRVTDTTKTNPSLEAGTVEFQVEKADNFDDQYVVSTSPLDPTDMYVGESNAADSLRTYSQALIQKNEDDEYTILSITPAAVNKSVTLAAEDFDESKSDDTKLYFYPAGTTRGSVKYELADEVAVYINGVKADVDYVTYIDEHETASVTLQKETNIGSTSSSSKYNTIMISSYATAIVDEVIDKTNETTIIFADQSAGLKARMAIVKDDENYTYNFTLDGEAIAATDLQEDDVLNIAYDTEDFANSNFYDVIVTRNVVSGVKCTGVNADGDEWTIGGTKYMAAEGMSPSIETSAVYNLYLDHFGYIAAVDEDSVNKNYGILKNIYKKAGGDYIAQVITKEGTEEEYKVDDKNVAAYTALLSTYNDTDKSADYTQEGATKVDLYPQQVIEYTVSSSTNKITIKNDVKPLDGTVSTNEYKAGSAKIGSVKLSDATVIIDISDVNTKDDYKVVSMDNLKDANEYTAVGFDKSESDNTHRFVLITDGVGGVNSETPLAIFNGSEIVEDGDDERIAYNVVVDGVETQVMLDEDVVGDDDYQEGDVILYATNSAGYVSEIVPVFAKTDMLYNTTFADFSDDVLSGEKILADTDWNALLSDSNNDDVDIVFGPVVNKNGNTIVLGTDVDAYPMVNYDTGLELTVADAKIYTYDFAASSKYSKVLLDEGMASTPNIKAAVEEVDGQEIIDLESDDLDGDVVYGVARVYDDEVQEIYLIVNND